MYNYHVHLKYAPLPPLQKKKNKKKRPTEDIHIGRHKIFKRKQVSHGNGKHNQFSCWVESVCKWLDHLICGCSPVEIEIYKFFSIIMLEWRTSQNTHSSMAIILEGPTSRGTYTLNLNKLTMHVGWCRWWWWWCLPVVKLLTMSQ